MMIDRLVEQARKSIRLMIDANPSTVWVARAAVDDNGIEDPFSDPYVHQCTVLFGTEKASIPASSESSIGMSTHRGKYLLFELGFMPKQEDVCLIRGKGYVLGPVNELTAYGTVIGYESPIYAKDDGALIKYLEDHYGN